MTWVSASFTSRQLYETLYVGQMEQLVSYPASPRGGFVLDAIWCDVLGPAPFASHHAVIVRRRVVVVATLCQT